MFGLFPENLKLLIKVFKSSYDMVILSCIQEAPWKPGGKLRSNADACYTQGRDVDADIENGRMDTGQGWGSGINWDFGIDIYIYIPPCIKYWVGQKFPSDFSIKPESLLAWPTQ